MKLLCFFNYTINSRYCFTSIFKANMRFNFCNTLRSLIRITHFFI